MIRWLSRRHPRYIRSIAYMLQASEYDVAHFLKWHERATDFTNIEKRKSLHLTLKARALVVSGWVTVLVVLFTAAAAFFNVSSPWSYIVSVFILLETPLFVLSGMLLCLMCLSFVQIPVEALLIALARRKLAAHKAIKIAIAGSYGKTSAREILRAVLGEGKKVAAPLGSYNTPLAISWFARGLRGDEEILIFEFGEYYPGDIKQLCELVQPDIGIITGVNEAHLEKFGTLEKTADTIFELADYLKKKPVYVNGENELARVHADEGHLLYDRNGCGTWRVHEAATSVSGTSFTLEHQNVQIACTSKLLGLHMVGPLVLAAQLGSALGLSLDQLQRGLGKTKPFEHRLQPHVGADGVVTLDDSYNGNPDGVRAVIEFLGSLQGNGIYVTPGLVEMGERKEEVHKEIGAQLARAHIRKVVLIRNSVTPFIEEGLKEVGYEGEIIWFNDGPSAYAALPRITVKGDIVLLQNDWPDQYF